MPRYEGRDLPRPDEEVFDQGLGFDLGALSRPGGAPPSGPRPSGK
jgi:hypothetical protein